MICSRTIDIGRRHIVSICLFVMIMCIFCSPIALASGGFQAKTQDPIGSDLYDISNALTTYANYVMGVNSNGKHANGIIELKGCGADSGGCIVGYGDPDSKVNKFAGSIGSMDSISTTNSSYVGWTRVGDGGSAYAYVRYGRLLADLGIDECAPVSSSNGGNALRSIFGKVLSFSYNLGAYLPKILDLFFALLRILNPFALLTNLSSPSLSGLITDGAYGVGMIGLGLGKVLLQFRLMYSLVRKLGVVVVLPFTLAVVVAYALMTKSGKKASKVMTWLKRAVFILIGIPVLGILYTASLDNVKELVLNNPSISKTVACSFFDFEYWVKSNRLALPFQVVSEGMSSPDVTNESGAADGNSIRLLRNNVLTAAKKEGLVSNMDAVSDPYTADAWDGTGVVVEGSSNLKNQMRKLTALLDRYASGDVYTGSNWSSDVHGALSSLPKGSNENLNSDANKGTVTYMFGQTDKAQSWMDRESAENAVIFKGSPDGWPCNIFYSATNAINVSSTDVNGKITYPAHSSSTGTTGIDTADQFGGTGGLSVVAMYNYLLTEFTSSRIVVHSPKTATSQFTMYGHYVVNLVGSGALSVAYGISVTATLFIIVLFSYLYIGGMILSLFKRIFSLFIAIPTAMVGFMKSIVQVITYVVMMIIEIFVTCLVYSIVTDLIYGLGMLVSNAIRATITVGGQTASVGSLNTFSAFYDSRWVYLIGVIVCVLSVVGFCCVIWKYRRSLMVGYETVMCMLWRFCTLNEFKFVFDSYLANRRSMYIYDELSFDLERFLGRLFVKKNSVLTSSCSVKTSSVSMEV